MMKEHTDN